MLDEASCRGTCKRTYMVRDIEEPALHPKWFSRGYCLAQTTFYQTLTVRTIVLLVSSEPTKRSSTAPNFMIQNKAGRR